MSLRQDQKSLPKSNAVFQNERSPSISDSSEDESDDYDDESAMEYILRSKRNELTSKLMLSGSDGLTNDLRKMDPETQARLEALLEAAGVGKLADGKGFTDQKMLRLRSSFSCALDEAAAALTRMSAQNNGMPSTPGQQTSDSGARSLTDACLEGDVNAVRKLLKEGWSVHEPTDDGESLLSLACSAGYYELAQVLLAMSANVDDRGSKGDCTPLMEAASGGFLEVVKLLMENGADLNAQSQAGNTALIYACCGGFEDVVKFLLQHGADIEAHNENGHTPLMEAASGGHVKVAQLLLDMGACINSHSNEFKESALTLACYKGHLEMVKFLLDAGADQEHKTDEMHTALMEASMDGHVEVARLLLDHGAQVNMPADSFESPLTLAACGGHVELAALLIERGAYLEEINDEGYTPLMEAAREGHLDMVHLLLEHGCDIHSQTEETQETALSLACCGGFQDVAEFLLQTGADIEQGSSTPLMEAAQECHVELVKFLLGQGADVTATTATGDTALSFACENGHTDVTDVLLAAGAELEHESEGGRTPLMKAARAGHLCTVQFLISRGANVNRQTTTNDHTVLSLACAGGHLPVVELLLAHGADPLHKLKDGSSMIIEAAKGGHASVVCFLLENPIHTTPPDLTMAPFQNNIATPSVPPPRVPPVHATQPPLIDDPEIEDLKLQQTFGRQSPLGSQLAPAPLLHANLDSTGSFLLPEVPITSSASCSTFSSVSQSTSNMSSSNVHVMATAVQTESTKALTEKLQLIQGQLAKALQRANLPPDSIPRELLENVTSDVTGLELDGEEVCFPPDPFSVPTSTCEAPGEEQVSSEGLMVAEPAQTLHDTIGSMLSDGSSEDSSPPTPPELSVSSLPLTPTPSPASPQFVPAMDVDHQTESNHDTALTLGAAGGHDELVNLLLDKDADIEHRDKKGCTPMILAATAGHASTVEILLDHGADIEAQSDRTKDTALSLACSGGRQEVVELLIAKGANFEHRNVSDYTPLSLAASGGYVGIIKLLLSHGAEINSRTGSKLGISPLMLAAMNGHTAAVKLLLDMGSDINAQIETNRNTALTLACFQGRHEVVILLVDRRANIEHRAKTGLTPLMEAASGGYVEVGRILLDRGADVNAPPVPSSRDTALTISADKGHNKFCDLLLSRGAMVDVKNKKGNSPLWLSANGGHLEVCQLLFSYGADVDSQDNRKVSVLMAAFRKGHVKVVKWLVKHVHQFPSDSECTRFISTLSDKDLLKKCNQGMEIIVTAKDRQAAEANKNASILLEEIDLEKEREELKKAAAARKRDKKKQKKKKKLQGEKEEAETNAKNQADGKENAEQDDKSIETESISIDAVVITAPVIDIKPVRTKRKRKSSAGSLDTLTTIAITAVDVKSAITTAAITKVMASTIVTHVTPNSALSPITVATAAAQCLAVTLTTTSVTTKMSTLPSPKKGKKHEDGWKEVVRRAKKMSVPSSVVSRVIGRGGCNVNAIRDTTGAHIDIDTNKQKVTGSCLITIKGPPDATRQAHQLICALVKDPECDITKVLPRGKSLSSRTSSVTSSTVHSSPVTTPVITSASTQYSKPSEPKTSGVPSKGTQGKKAPTAPSQQAPVSATNGHPQALHSSAGSSTSKATHIPSTARWASTQASTVASKKVPLSAHQVKVGQTLPTCVVTTTLTTATAARTGHVHSNHVTSTAALPATPAKRQLFPDSAPDPPPVTARPASKVTRLRKGSPTYSSAVLGNTVVSTEATGSWVSGQALRSGAFVPVTTTSAVLSTTSVSSSTTMSAISNILSHVSPSVWNDIAHPSNRPSQGPLSDQEHLQAPLSADPINQPLYITTPGALFNSLEATSSSPPCTVSGSPVPTTVPSASTSPAPSPIGAPGKPPLPDPGEKPSLRPIGTERACRRVSASPLPSVPGISPLIGSEGTQVAGVWSFSYTSDPSLSSSWSAPRVSSAPSPTLVSGMDSVPVSDEEHIGVQPEDTLQTFLERLSLSGHLSLFQENEIDLDALLLMSEKDYADIGLPKGPRVKLLNSTRRVYTGEPEYAGAAPGTAVVTGPAGLNAPAGLNVTWNHQGAGAVPNPGGNAPVHAGVPYGVNRAQGREDPNKRSSSWKAWSRAAV